VWARRAVPGDEAAILGLYESLSDDSRYTRFFQPTPRITSRLRATLVSLDGSILWLAFDGATCVGEARLVNTNHRPGSADMAVTVADDYQRRGLGPRLARLAVRDACEQHLVEFTVAILPVNTGAARLARRTNIALRFDEGILEGAVALRPCA
jgi:acetyltransferase